VEASAVAAVDVHVAAEGLGGAKLPSAEGAGVGPRRPCGAHDVPCVFCKSSDLPRVIIIFYLLLLMLLLPRVPHPSRRGGGGGAVRVFWLRLLLLLGFGVLGLR